MTEQELREIIAGNIVYYRTQAGMTQLQLAEHLNYSDKSVSKWENADGMPDVYVLNRMSELFNIELSDLTQVKKRKKPISQKKQRILIIAMAVCVVVLLATVVFGLGYFFSKNEYFALAFAYAVPVSGIVTLILASAWKWRIVSGIATSVIIWGAVLTIITSIYSFFPNDTENIWTFIVIAVVFQALAIMWFFFRGLLQKAKDALVNSFEKSREKSRKKHDKNNDGEEGN